MFKKFKAFFRSLAFTDPCPIIPQAGETWVLESPINRDPFLEKDILVRVLEIKLSNSGEAWVKYGLMNGTGQVTKTMKLEIFVDLFKKVDV